VSANQQELLRAVSRSFYLSIRALPRALREPVGLAYLLARTSDTIADCAGVEIGKRLALLDRFADAVVGKGELAGEWNGELAGLTDGEKNLLSAREEILRQLKELSDEDRRDVQSLLATITRGQRLDLTRWSGELKALANADELREYTYLVAGCVGEFWTRICFRQAQGFTARSEADMLALGKNYGCGLQLINILRDAGEDLRVGRCYFPEDELRAANLAPEDLLDGPNNFLPIYQRWINEARRGLDAGMDYSIAINPARVRLATVLPALIGVRTLALLEERGLEALRTRVKISRGEVRSIVASAAITLANRSRLRSARARL